MGIPVFFKTLITDYTHVIEPVTNQKVDNLFFDLNCLLHPSCASIKDGNEDEMIKKMVEIQPNVEETITCLPITFIDIKKESFKKVK